MPSRLWYVAAAAILLIGVALGVSFLVPRITGMGDDFIRVVVPGEHEIELTEAGSYTILHEPSGALDGVVYAANDISGLRVSLVSSTTGAEIRLESSTVSSRYSAGGHTGFSIFGFDVAEPGPYRLIGAYDDGRSDPSTILAISHGFVRKLLTTILGTIAIFFASAGIALAIGLTTFVRRRRVRRSISAALPRS